MITSSTPEKKLPTGRLALAAFLIVVYTLVFPAAVPKELQVSPVARIAITDLPLQGPGDFTFQLGGHFGWFDRQGSLKYSAATPSELAVGDSKYASFNSETAAVDVFKAGQKLFSVPGARYAYWIGEKLFILQPDRLGASEISAAGQPVWDRNFTALITSLDSTKNLTVFGLSSGQLQVLDNTGTPRFTFAPGGSRLPVIYNTRLAPDDSRLAVLAGVDPKRFILMERSKNEFRPVLQKNLDDTSLFPTPTGFLANGSLVYYYTGAGLNVIRTNDLSEHAVAFVGQLDSIDYDPKAELLVTLTREGGAYRFSLLPIDSHDLIQFRFTSKESFLKVDGNQYFVGVDGAILILKQTRS